jgi:hypothetical protein
MPCFCSAFGPSISSVWVNAWRCIGGRCESGESLVKLVSSCVFVKLSRIPNGLPRV